MRRQLLTSTLLQAGSTLGLQVLAMVTLEPRLFGAFSLVYLAAALGQSVAASVVLDPWLVVDADARSAPHVQRGYDASLVWMAVLSALVAGAVGAVATGAPWVAVLGAVAAAAALHRSGNRYRAMAERDYRPVVLGDALGLLTVLAGAGAAIALGGLDLLGAFAVWSASAVAAAIVHRRPASGSPRVAARWVRERWPRIRALLVDSSLMDLGAIGTPYVIGGLAGLSALGIYRGVSNVAAPVRLVLGPLRPVIVEARMTRARWAMVAGASLVFGVGAWAALLLLEAMSWELGTLDDLAPLAVPTAVFVAANCMGHTAYLVARGSAGIGGLMLGRLIQTVLAVAVPIAGVLLAGVAGAAWGLAGATACSAAAWTCVAVSGARALEAPR
jgi:hypothetical protein